MKQHLPWLLMLAVAAAVAGITVAITDRHNPGPPPSADTNLPVVGRVETMEPGEADTRMPKAAPVPPVRGPEQAAVMREAPRRRLEAGVAVAPPVPQRIGGGSQLREPPRRFSLDDKFATARERMVNEQLAATGRNIINPNVLNAMKTVLRHQFTPAQLLAMAYEDQPLDIGFGRVMESPYVVASVAEMLESKPTDRVLTVNLDFGYQAAVLSFLAKEVYAIDPQETFAQNARVDFERLGYTNNLFVRCAALAEGWPEAGPFDAMVLNGTLDDATAPLLAQLKNGGRLIIPVAEDGKLHVYQKSGRQLIQVATRNIRPPAAPANPVELPAVKMIRARSN